MQILEDFYKAYEQLTPEQRNQVVAGSTNPLTIREIYLMCRENERVALAALSRIETLLTLTMDVELVE